jgi:hypothetical protein
MADIFISYAREDRQVAERVASALETYGWSVFWDRRIPAGRRFDEFIEEQLDTGRCIVTLWSSHGVASHWVREDSATGRDRGILVPVKIEEVAPPLGFRSIQCADLIDWAGDEVHPGFRQLMGDLATNLGAPPHKPSPAGTDRSFRMTIDDVFQISGRGVVVTGTVTSGVCRVGQEVVILKGSSELRRCQVGGIEMFRKVLDKAKAGDGVGILLNGIERSDVEPGMILASLA